MKYKGACFCGAVEIEAEGAPEGMGYCLAAPAAPGLAGR